MKREEIRAFTELRVMANHDSQIRALVSDLYDTAVDRIIVALGNDLDSQKVQALREALYLLLMVVAGSAPVMGYRAEYHPQRLQFKTTMRNLMAPLILSIVEQREA